MSFLRKQESIEIDSASLERQTSQARNDGWLTKKDWMPLAEILVTSQTRASGKTTGTFVVKCVYPPEEQKVLGTIFRRMYGW